MRMHRSALMVLLLLLSPWTAVQAQLVQVGLDGTSVVAVVAEQGDPGEQWFPVTSNALFAATRDMVWQGRTWDDGKSWMPIGPFADPPVDIVTLGLQHWGAGPMDGLHLLASVREADPSPERPVLLRHSVRYVGPFDSVWVRADSGLTHDDTASVVHAIASYYYTGHTPPQPVLAWTGATPWRGWPGGLFWDAVSIDIPTTVVSMDVTPKWFGTDAWAAGWTAEGPGDAVVLRSRDAGATWTAFGFPRALPSRATAVAVEPGHPDTAYAGIDGSLRRTTDGGANWELVFGSPGGYFNALACDPGHAGRLFAAVDAAEFMLYRSDDFGSSWRRILPGPDQHPASITTMSIALVDTVPMGRPARRALFLGTAGTGVWRYDIDLDPTSVEAPPAPETPRIDLSPNPASTAVTAHLQLATSGEITATLHDILGRVVRQRSLGPREAGVHSITFDVSDLVPGVYVVRAEGGRSLLRVVR